MTVVPTVSGESNVTTATGTNVSGDVSTTGQGTAVTAAAVSGIPVTVSAGDGVHGVPLLRRNRPGTKTAAFSSWPEEDWAEMDSTLAVQQVNYLTKNERGTN